MAQMLIRHKVKDFRSWKPAFDAHRAARQAAGLKDLYLWHNLDDPTEVLLLFEASNPDKARSFSESPDLKDAMKKAGVVGRPDIVFLTD